MIAHLAINNFWTQVEMSRDHSLVRRPLVIAAAKTPQSPIISVSDNAAKEGLFCGMSIYAAQKQVPNVAITLPNYHLYQEAQKSLNLLADRYSPLVETAPGSIFMDLNHSRYLYKSPERAATLFYHEVTSALNLHGPLTMAGSRITNQVAAKLTQPNEPLFVAPGCDRPFMAPLPINMLPSIGPKRYSRCRLLSIRTIGDLASLSRGATIAAFGKFGPELQTLAQGIDLHQLKSHHEQQQLAHRHTLPFATNDLGVITTALHAIAIELAHQLRSNDLSAKVLILQITYSDWATCSRQISLKRALVTERDLFFAEKMLLESALTRRVAVTAIATALRKLGHSHHQLEFDFSIDKRQMALQMAKDKIVDKFGANIVA